MTAVLVFLKYPERGRVKTRLAQTVGADPAVAIYRQLLQATLRETDRLPPDQFRVYALCDPSRPLADYQKLLSGHPVQIALQVGENLGERLAHAFHSALKEHPRALAIGTDCPDLTTPGIEQAAAAVTHRQVVLGPAGDGGYYLLGMGEYYPELFADIPWSTGEVLARTKAAAETLGLKIVTLPELHDVDTEEDWKRWTRSEPAEKRWD